MQSSQASGRLALIDDSPVVLEVVGRGLEEMGWTVHRALGGEEGIARIDLMLEDRTQRILLLEINTIPGMTAMSLVPKAAQAIGMSFNDVVAEVLEAAGLKVSETG